MIFGGERDMDEDGLRGANGILTCIALSLVILCICAFAAFAQQSQPSDCSGTATNVAADIAFPTSGATGPTYPSQYLTIANPSSSATLWVCAAKGCTAAAGGAGSFSLSPIATAGQNGISWWKGAFPPPARVSIVSSAGSSSFSCNYQ